MKKIYTRDQIKKIISKLKKRLISESLTSTTESKLKDAAKKFAKWFGDQIKSGQVQRFEDENNTDALIAIKNIIKLNSSVKNMIKFLKSPKAQGIVPTYAIESIAEAGVKTFISNVFDGSKALVEELNKAINTIDSEGTTEEYIQFLIDAIQDDKNKKLQNLKKSTEQFNYFANVVFGIWKRDPEITSILSKIPKLPETTKDLEDLNLLNNQEDIDDTNNNTDNDTDDDTDEDIDKYLADSEEIEEDDILKKSPHNGDAQHNAHVDEDEIPESELMKFIDEDEINEGDINGNTVEDLIKALKRNNCKLDDTLLLRVNKKECFIYDIYSKGNGIAVIDMVPGRL